MIRKMLLLCLGVILGQGLMAQQISGRVLEIDQNGQQTALPGVNIIWLGTQEGTISDVNGNYSLPKSDASERLVFSYIGYRNDTLKVNGSRIPDLVMKGAKELEEVNVSARSSGTHVSRLDPIFTQVVSSEELGRAACCNLSESFETNASVDVSYADAATGAKRISLLGLSGIYSPLLIENMPNLRGLASVWGLSYVPGTWMQSIQVSKGTASVVNGYESMSGQINVEYKKPADEKLFLNLYLNQMGKVEANSNVAFKVAPRLETALFLHYENLNSEHDDNGDGFIDQPLIEQYNVLNRWKYTGKKLRAQWGVKAIHEERKAGQLSSLDLADPYRIYINTDRLEVFTKTGYILNRLRDRSFGVQNQLIWHQQDAGFGRNAYNASQFSYYGNFIYQSKFINRNNLFKLGASYTYDAYNEDLNNLSKETIESVPGVFGEYTYNIPDKLAVIAGARVDQHSLYGTFFTPRLHIRYTINENHILRASVGKGYRSPHVIAENEYLLASNARFVFTEEEKAEEAWNFGVNYTQYFDLWGRNVTLNLEAYRTSFINQIVIDRDTDKSKILVSNLDGESYSNSFQAEINTEVVPRVEMTLAFRYNDVKTTLNSQLKTPPLVNRFKGLLALSWATKQNKWQFDINTQLNGDSRLPDRYADENGEKYSPVYAIANAQVTRRIGRWSIYLGGENLGGYVQDNPIVDPQNPYRDNFDAASVWGPIDGTKVYAGFKFLIK